MHSNLGYGMNVLSKAMTLLKENVVGKIDAENVDFA